MSEQPELDALPCAVIITDPFGQIVFINQLAKTAFLAEPDAIPTNIDKLFPPASKIFLQTHLWPMLRKQGEVNEFYLQIQSKEHKVVPILLNVAAGEFAQQACYRWVLLPALQRVTFEQELLKARQQTADYAQEISLHKRRLQNILDAAADIAIITLDKDGRVQFANAGVMPLLGVSKQQLLGEPFANFMSQQGLAQAGQLRLQQQLSLLQQKSTVAESILEFETRLIQHSGQEIDVLLQLRPLAGELAQADRQLLVVATDISKRKQLERLQNEFVATISHEFRTPLTTILGSLTLLSERFRADLPDKAQKLVEVSFNSSQRLKHLVNDLLDFGKINSGKVQVSLQRCALTPLLESSIVEHHYYLNTKGVQLLLRLPETPFFILTDPQRFQQVMANLLSNAIKFSPAAGQVHIWVSEQADNLIISVQDCGPGIKADFATLLFTQFTQEDNSSNRQVEGTGLGLAISKGLVNAMGGEIGYQAAQPHGAIFWFSCAKA